MGDSDMKKSLAEKAFAVFALTAALLLACGIILTGVENYISQRNESAAIQSRMQEVPDIIQNDEENAAQATESFDANGISKANTLAYMFRKHPALGSSDTVLARYAKAMKLGNLLILDRTGEIKAAAQKTEIDFTRARYNELRTVFTSGKASEPFNVTTGEVKTRYYAARISDDAEAVVLMDPADLDAQLSEINSWESILSVLNNGSLEKACAISSQNDTFLWYPEKELIGKNVMAAGVDPDKVVDGMTSRMTISGRTYYCGVRYIDTKKAYVVCMIPEKTYFLSGMFAVFVTLFGIFAAFTVVAFYSAERVKEVVLEDGMTEAGTGTVSHREVRKAVARATRGRLRSLSAVGVIIVFLLGFYLQTLCSLSRTSITGRQTLDSIAETLKDNQQDITDLTEDYNSRNLNKARTAAMILSWDPQLKSHGELTELANALDVEYIILFDKNGRETASSNSYVNFEISSDPADQSYEFRKILDGVEYVIQKPQNDQLSGQFRQYIGCLMTDDNGAADGMLQIAVYPERLEKLLASTGLDAVLSGVHAEDNGFAFAVAKSDGTFSWYPDSTMIGQKASDFGLQDSQKNGNFSGYITIAGTRYFASCLDAEKNYIFICSPKTQLAFNRMLFGSVSAACATAGLLIIYFFVVMLYHRDMESEEVPADNESMIDVVSADGTIKKSEAASKRWSDKSIPWAERTAEQKTGTVFYGIMCILAVLICLAVLLQNRLFDKNSIFRYIISGQWQKGFNVFSMTACVLAVCVVVTAMVAISFLLMVLANSLDARGETVVRLIRSFLKYVIVIGLLFYCLSLFGVNATALATSAGILTLVIGIGAKDLFTDILAGLFIIFEGEFQVGDIVTVGDFRGTVQEIGIRTTKIMDGGGNVKVFPNSTVNGVINMTRRHSFCVVDVGVEYKESLERVESVLSKELPKLAKKFPTILEGPFYKGVTQLGDNSVSIRIIAKCNESDRLQLQRDLNRAVLLIFKQNDISIPYPQIVVNQPTVFREATRREKTEADKYNKQQKEESKNTFATDADGGH
jgi:small-conductance mechanosensitive channel